MGRSHEGGIRSPIFRHLDLLRDLFHLLHHAQEVAAPDGDDVLFAIAAAHEFERHVERLAGVVEAGDAATAVKVGTDAGVLDADNLDHIVDVVDEVLDRRSWRRRELGVEFRQLQPVGGEHRVVGLGAGGPPAPRPPRRAAPPGHHRAELRPQRRNRRRALGRVWRGRLHVAVERHELHHATVLLERQQLFVVEVAAVVAQRAHPRVAGDHRRPRHRHHLQVRRLGRMRDVHHDAVPVGLLDDLPAERGSARSTSRRRRARPCSSRRAGCARCGRATGTGPRGRRTA